MTRPVPNISDAAAVPAPPLEPGILPPPPRAALAWVLCGYAAVWGVGWFVTYHVVARDSGEMQWLQYLSAHHTSFGNALALGVHYLFGPVAAVGWAVVIAGVISWRLGVRRGGVFLVLVLWGWLSGQLVKRVVMRPRPDPTLLVDPLAAETTSFSYPSGHVSFVTALVVSLALVLWVLPVVPRGGAVLGGAVLGGESAGNGVVSSGRGSCAGLGVGAVLGGAVLGGESVGNGVVSSGRGSCAGLGVGAVAAGRRRMLLSTMVVLLVGLTAWSRMYVGVHYPSDVAMAVVNVSASVTLALVVARWWMRRSQR